MNLLKKKQLLAIIVRNKHDGKRIRLEGPNYTHELSDVIQIKSRNSSSAIKTAANVIDTDFIIEIKSKIK